MTRETDTQPSVSLTIPCRAEYVALCRLVAGALGVREALDDETIADIKVIVTEAFNCFLGAAESGNVAVEPSAAEPEGQSPVVEFEFGVDPVEWNIVVSNPDRTRRISQAPSGDPLSERALSLTILEALVDSMELTDSDAEGSVFHLAKTLSPEALESD